MAENPLQPLWLKGGRIFGQNYDAPSHQSNSLTDAARHHFASTSQQAVGHPSSSCILGLSSTAALETQATGGKPERALHS